MTKSPHSSFGNEEYTVGWICALPIELTAARGMLDEQHGDPQTPPAMADKNTYVLGSMGKFKVVVACLPLDRMGSVSATAVANRMLFTFPNIRVCLLVGIGAGIPDYKNHQDIRLGDVVISSHPETGGVVVYDFGKKLADGSFHSISALNRPPESLTSALGKMKSEHDMHDNKIAEYIDQMLEKYPKMRKKGYFHPGPSFDRLFQPDCPHIGSSCADCDPSKEVCREERLEEMSVVHYGTIASGNMVVKNASLREEIRAKHGAICLEMEAAGLMNSFPCIVIRGISDYADVHKNDRWQPCAAAAAAACAKEFLEHLQPRAVDGTPAAKEILSRG
jgi:nucleoside phosphorylase